jgi:putative transposase
MANEQTKIDAGLLDELLKDQDPQTVFSADGLLGELKKALAERMLDAEMELHLGSEEERAAGNHRNGRSPKRVLTDSGALPLTIPRDRHGRFEPKLIEKYKRRFPGFDEKIIALYARGMSTRDIQAHIRELYGLDISPDLVSAVTDAVHDEANAWQSRPLEPTYAIVYFDALRVKIRDEGAVRNKAVYLAIGIRCSGQKEILGLWIEQSEGAKFWLRVMTELKNRGTQDILIAVVDGLKGFPEAIESVFPQAEVQTCIVHLIRYSMQFASWKERKAIAKELRPIYQAETAALAAERLELFDAGEWGTKYPAIAQAWRRKWEQVIPFFAFAPAVRRIIYTTNAIESLHSQVRKAVRSHGHFPSDKAASKLIYLVLQNIEAKWTRPPIAWHQAKAQFAIHFEDRFVVTD